MNQPHNHEAHISVQTMTEAIQASHEILVQIAAGEESGDEQLIADKQAAMDYAVRLGLPPEGWIVVATVAQTLEALHIGVIAPPVGPTDWLTDLLREAFTQARAQEEAAGMVPPTGDVDFVPTQKGEGA